MIYSMEDFDELESLAGEARKYFPSDPEGAVDHFANTYTHLISCILVTNTWAYLEAEHIIHTGNRADPLDASRKWKASDFKSIEKHYRN